MVDTDTAQAYLDSALKIIQIVIIPGIWFFYKEVRNISDHLSMVKFEIAKLAPMDRFMELNSRVTILETRLSVILDNIESDIKEIKDKINS